MDDYAGRLLADRYRLPRLPSEEFELAETRAFDTASGQEVLMRQVPLPEVVEAEVVGDERGAGGGAWSGASRATRRPADPLVRRAVEAARAAADIPDHPRLDQVFDVFVEGDGLWIVSELVAARPLAILLAERPLGTHRAAEVAADLLAALRVVHAHGWVHRNLTSRTVLICDDGRALLTGLAVGAAEEALCGYDPLPSPDRPALPRGILPSTQTEPRPMADPWSAPGQRTTSGGYPGGDAPVTPRPRDAWTGRTGALAAYRAGARSNVEQDTSAPQRHEGSSAVPGPRRDGRPGPGGTESGSTVLAVPDDGRYRGPSTALAAERARQARIAMVGSVTERWAPEQAGPVYEHWRLAPPVGPAADLWALGALLFRTVQGHPPFPEEEGAAELTQMVCGEPPAYAEDCGALRPVVESLLRQDPTERPDVEQLRGWLRSLIRSAPEPDVGRHTISVPSSPEPGTAADPRRLPVPRRRGELARRRRAGASPVPTERRRKQTARRPRALGWLLVSTVLLGVAAALVYAMLFMPKINEGGTGARGPERSGAPTGGSQPSGDAGERPDTSSRSPDTRQPQTTHPGDAVGKGYSLRKDPAGFRIAVPDGWQRRGQNGRGQVRYVGDGYQLIVVSGRDSTATFGSDPMAYQNQKEAELAPYRSSDWSSASGLRRIDVAGTALAEGEFSWRDSRGRQVFAQNRATIQDGGYHLVLVIGPLGKRDTVREHFAQIADTYRVSGG